MNTSLRGLPWTKALRSYATLDTPSVVSLGSCLHVLDRGGVWQLASHVLMEAFAHKHESNAVALGSIISAMEAAEEWQEALQVLQLCQRQRLRPNLVMKSACAAATVSGSAWHMASGFLPDDHWDGVSQGTLISACKKASWISESFGVSYFHFSKGDSRRPNSFKICLNLFKSEKQSKTKDLKAFQAKQKSPTPRLILGDLLYYSSLPTPTPSWRPPARPAPTPARSRRPGGWLPSCFGAPKAPKRWMRRTRWPGRSWRRRFGGPSSGSS